MRHEGTDLVTVLSRETGKLETFNIYTGEMVQTEHAKYVYTLELADAIYHEVLKGTTLTSICRLESMPPLYILYKWRSTYPDFDRRIKNAKKLRGDYYMDKATETLETTTDSDRNELALSKFKFDGYLKLAEKSNPDEYAAKANQLNLTQTPATIVINTGIDRTPDTIEVVDEEVCIARERSESGLRGTHEVPRIGAEIEEDEPNKKET